MADIFDYESCDSIRFIVKYHFLGATLQRRFKDLQIPNHPAYAADRQTAREGDFVVARTVYHFAAPPTRAVAQKCSLIIRARKHPVLLVPQEKVYVARVLVEEEGLEDFVSIFSLEDFIALNMIAIAIEADRDFFAVLMEIVDIYNRRIEEVETDLSLRIKLY